MNILEHSDYYKIGGRYTWQEEKLCLAFSASYLEFQVEGGRVFADIESDDWAEEETLKAWVAVFVNDESEPVNRFCLKKGMERYELFCAEPNQIAKIRLMKYSENAFAKVAIASVRVDGGQILPYQEEKRRLIEFIGDSITCGYGVEGICEVDTFTTRQENPKKAYACLTAENLGYDFALVSWSGNGFISHYIDDSVDEPRHDKPFLQELYPYADLELESRLGKSEYTLWQPKKSPDIIVIHVGTNDCSYTRERKERNDCYKKEYVDFVKRLREKNPEASIICMLGVMDQRLNRTLEAIVEELRTSDAKVYFVDSPIQDPQDGLGADYHPSPVTHQKLANQLTEFIKEYVK